MKLQGKIALVTGAGKGIGTGIAQRLAEEGADVALNYAHSTQGAERAAKAIRAMGRRAITVCADVSKAAEVQAMVARTVSELGRLDILVNNAGVDPHIHLLEMTEEQWDWVLDTNLKGTFLCSQAAAREMLKTGGGKIIIISSIHATATYMHITAYAASKGGLNALTRQMALELGPHHINVNAIAPGCIPVDKNWELMPNFDPHMFDSEIPLGYAGTPSDIGDAAAFLASDEARFINGAVLTVDGGTLARMSLGMSSQNDVLAGMQEMKQDE